MNKHQCIATAVAFAVGTLNLVALDYPCTTAEPQKTGWPLTDEERKYVLLPEHERRPGREVNQHKPELWPLVPSAGNWGGTSWLDTHANLVKVAQASKGPIDVLLVGDSITMQWGAAWTKHFPTLKTVNIGIGGDKTQNLLWRLDHGGVEGLQPKVIVLMIGNNNMFFTPETGIEAAAKGIEMCAKNLREKFPAAPVIVAKILPAHAPGVRFYEDIKKTNLALDPLKLDSDRKVTVLDLTADFTNTDGTLVKDLFKPDNIHLTPAGYAAYAGRLKPLLDAMFSGKPIPAPPVRTKINATTDTPAPVRSESGAWAPKAATGIVLEAVPDLISQSVMGYAYTCPGMIGGGEYRSFLSTKTIDEELVVRSAQVHALMPMMEFSAAPWRILSKENEKLTG